MLLSEINVKSKFIWTIRTKNPKLPRFTKNYFILPIPGTNGEKNSSIYILADMVNWLLITLLICSCNKSALALIVLPLLHPMVRVMEDATTIIPKGSWPQPGPTTALQGAEMMVAAVLGTAIAVAAEITSRFPCRSEHGWRGCRIQFQGSTARDANPPTPSFATLITTLLHRPSWSVSNTHLTPLPFFRRKDHHGPSFVESK